MRIAMNLAVILSVGLLAACNSEVACTAEEAQKKSADLSARITEVGTADPARLAELTPRLQELTTSAAGGEDLAATCKAMDEMMAELAN
jgi:G:T/U-mismatch repair DNA glycosylase